MMDKFIENIPYNSKIALYGAGTCGKEIKKYIEENRPDIKIVFWIEANKTGEEDGLKIISLKDLAAYKHLFNVLIVTIRTLAHELIEIFDYLDIPFLMISRKLENSIRLKPFMRQQKLAQDILFCDEDKKIYNMVWETRCGGDYKKIEQYALKEHNIQKFHPVRNYNRHYLEYINKDAIKTIVDAGFCNGIHSLAFKKNFKNLKKIYAFEPMYESFKNRNYDKLIMEDNLVEIIPLGLWHNSDTLEFCENTANKGASRIIGTKNQTVARANERISRIKTTSLDEFVKDRNLEKIDFIKMDIEASEQNAIAGGLNTIKSHRPQMAISIYHTVDDFVSIPVLLHEQLENYVFRIGHYSYDIYETVLYAIPKELL